MDLHALRIVNCFGFADSTANLEPKLIYLLGRNSSGKTSFLDALNNIASQRVPESHPRFANFRPTKTAPQITATFVITAPISLDPTGAVTELLRGRGVPAQALADHKQFQDVLVQLKKAYADLAEAIAAEGTLTLTKFGSGACQLTVGDRYKEATERRKHIDGLIARVFSGSTFSAAGGNYAVTAPTSADLDRHASSVIPRIAYYSDSYSLIDDLPDYLTSESTRRPPNRVTNAFVKFLGADDTETLLTTNDPDDQDRLRQTVQRRAKALAATISRDAARLVEITLSTTPNGLQITMRTDGKKSFYRHLSDATKFLVAYHIYAQSHEPGAILLFDEPSRGLHASAEQYVREFLERISVDNHVVVSTHSEHLLDIERLDRVRLMQQDEKDYLSVASTLRPPRNRQGYLLALQPVFDAIGLTYAAQKLTHDRVLLTEGLTDYLYLTAFRKLLAVDADYGIAPGRGESSLFTLVPFLISQGVSLKILLDSNSIKSHLQDAFGIPDKAIYVIASEGTQYAGIEDVFSRTDYRRVLLGAGIDVAETDLVSANSVYAKQTNKRLVAQMFLTHLSNYELASLDDQTRSQIEGIVRFSANDDWWRLD